MLSKCSYLLNLIGSLIDCRPLQDQCCRILSALLLHLKRNISTDVTVMLGEQLQVYSFSICTVFPVLFFIFALFSNILLPYLNLCSVERVLSSFLFRSWWHAAFLLKPKYCVIPLYHKLYLCSIC